MLRVDPVDLLRACIRVGKYQISPEDHVLAQQAAERELRVQKRSESKPGPDNAQTLKNRVDLE